MQRVSTVVMNMGLLLVEVTRGLPQGFQLWAAVYSFCELISSARPYLFVYSVAQESMELSIPFEVLLVKLSLLHSLVLLNLLLLATGVEPQSRVNWDLLFQPDLHRELEVHLLALRPVALNWDIAHYQRCHHPHPSVPAPALDH